MNALAEARYLQALDALDITIAVLEGSMERTSRDALLRVRGNLVAMRQLLDMEETLAQAKTQPAVRLVK